MVFFHLFCLIERFQKYFNIFSLYVAVFQIKVIQVAENAFSCVQHLSVSFITMSTSTIVFICTISSCQLGLVISSVFSPEIFDRAVVRVQSISNVLIQQRRRFAENTLILHVKRYICNSTLYKNVHVSIP